MRALVRRGAALAGAVLAGTTIWLADPANAGKPSGTLTKAQDIEIMARPIPFDRGRPGQTRFDGLEWLGTLELTSQAPHFGGYSGLAVSADGKRLIAVSDAGTWLTAEIGYRNGRLASLTRGRIGPLRARDGKPLRRRNIDAEALAGFPEGGGRGSILIAFEQNHRIGTFPASPTQIKAPKRYLTLPARAKSAKGNKGLEAVAVIRSGPAKGSVLALTEEYLDKSGNHYGWLLGGKKPGQVTVRRLGGFALTGAASLPDGDVVLLERRFRFTEGVKMRLRRIKAAGIKPGALLDGEALLAVNSLFEIDNMEGVAAHRGTDGRTILTLISDDNFNDAFQRTILMQFALPN